MVSSAAIRVYVLEGPYAQLSTLGFPVSLVLELQQGGLRLDNAKWSSRRSDAGFSVSFFWPVALTPRRRRHRQRRKPRGQTNFNHSTVNCNDFQHSNSPCAAAIPPREAPTTRLIPSNAHHHDLQSSATGSPVALPPHSHQASPSTSESDTAFALPPPSLQSSDHLDSSAFETDHSGSEATQTSQIYDFQQQHLELGTAASLQHLDDADVVEFDFKDDEPAVKYTTGGKVGWTPISLKNRFSSERED